MEKKRKFGKSHSAKVWSKIGVQSCHDASLQRIHMILRIFFRFGLINRASNTEAYCLFHDRKSETRDIVNSIVVSVSCQPTLLVSVGGSVAEWFRALVL